MFIIGGEDRSLSDAIMNKCDEVVKIPLEGQINSLNMGVATGVVMYDKLRHCLLYTSNILSMQKFLSRNKIILIVIAIFVFLRIPSLFEGFWYPDEGFYAAQAEAILKGKELYIGAWDHKPPMMVWIYTCLLYTSETATYQIQVMRKRLLIYSSI